MIGAGLAVALMAAVTVPAAPAVAVIRLVRAVR